MTYEELKEIDSHSSYPYISERGDIFGESNID